MEEERKETIVENQGDNTTKQTEQTKKKSKIRMILVIVFIAIFAIVSYIQVRGSYLEYLELGENYVQVFWTNLIYGYAIMAINFVVLFVMIYMTNRGIKKD